MLLLSVSTLQQEKVCPVQRAAVLHVAGSYSSLCSPFEDCIDFRLSQERSPSFLTERVKLIDTTVFPDCTGLDSKQLCSLRIGEELFLFNVLITHLFAPLPNQELALSVITLIGFRLFIPINISIAIRPPSTTV